jgi:hypothetical protein
MPRKKLLWSVLAIGMLSSNGCCGMWDRWCNPQPRCYQPAPPQCGCAPVAPAAPACPPGTSYSPSASQVQAVGPAPAWSPTAAPPR